MFGFVTTVDARSVFTNYHILERYLLRTLTNFNFDTVPIKTSVTDELLEIEWNDNHKSTFSVPWLIKKQFTNEAQNNWKENVFKDNKIIWTAEQFPRILKKFTFSNILERDSELLSWLESLAIWGVAIIENAGQTEGKNQLLAERVAFLKQTQFGNVIRIEAKPEATNVGYLSVPLELHTDLPYYNYNPGVNLLHCIIQGEEGGENHLADCFAVAKEIKEKNYEIYSVLRDTNVIWSDKFYEGGRYYHSIHDAPVICENKFGEIERINFSQPQRDSQFNVPLEHVNKWYNALRAFSELINSPKYSVLFHLKPGAILTFDNLRLAHGRAEYNGHRYMEGLFLDWDHIYSRIRVLRANYSYQKKK
ncbi:gamma-butyrobetaine dioxygenase-like isoform X1 [Lycorma delicatula]|uniref:gamma-butyrobetaine dioxygenase-like isoform X1 n=2 Tax=Lycorma delicatula TaxID=130591 RepID=UPI003F516582